VSEGGRESLYFERAKWFSVSFDVVVLEEMRKERKSQEKAAKKECLPVSLSYSLSTLGNYYIYTPPPPPAPP